MLQGYYFTIQADEIKEVFNEDMSQYWDQAYPLTQGSIFDIPGKDYKKLKFDFNGLNETWDGYVVGYLYLDNKFLGTFFPIAEAKLPKTKLTGTYQFNKGIIKISGLEYDEAEKNGFYIELEETKKENTNQSITFLKTTSYKEILSVDLANSLSAKAEKSKRKVVKKYNHYNGLINAGLKADTENDFLLSASAAYSWMPTMLDLYPAEPGRFSKELKAVQQLGAIKTIVDFNNKEEQIKKCLSLLCNTINRSIVGTSKTLHLFYPVHIPILDSRVLKAWLKIFGKHYKKYPSLKLGKTIPYNSNRQVPLYMKYWKLMLQWKENAGCNSVRELEETLYWLGGS